MFLVYHIPEETLLIASGGHSFIGSTPPLAGPLGRPLGPPLGPWEVHPELQNCVPQKLVGRLKNVVPLIMTI